MPVLRPTLTSSRRCTRCPGHQSETGRDHRGIQRRDPSPVCPGGGVRQPALGRRPAHRDAVHLVELPDEASTSIAATASASTAIWSGTVMRVTGANHFTADRAPPAMPTAAVARTALRNDRLGERVAFEPAVVRAQLGRSRTGRCGAAAMNWSAIHRPLVTAATPACRAERTSAAASCAQTRAKRSSRAPRDTVLGGHREAPEQAGDLRVGGTAAGTGTRVARRGRRTSSTPRRTRPVLSMPPVCTRVRPRTPGR